MASSACRGRHTKSGARQVRTVVACRKKFMLLNECRRASGGAPRICNKSVRQCHRNSPPRPCRSGSCLQVSTLSSRHRPTSAPSPGPSEKQAACSTTLPPPSKERHDGEIDEYFLGTMLFIEAEAGLAPRRVCARSRACSRWSTVSQRLTTLTICSAFCATSTRRRRDGRTSACWRPSRPGRAARPAVSVCRCGNPTRPSSRPTCAIRVPQALQPVRRHPIAAGSADRRRARSLAARRCGTYDPAQRRRLADFLLDKCHVVVVSTTGIDRAHRMFTVLNATGKPLARNDILKADLLGGVPPAAMKKRNANLGSQRNRTSATNSRTSSAIFAPFTARNSPQVISGIRNIAAVEGGGLPFIERILQPAAAIYEDIRKSRHEGSPHSRAIHVADLSRLAEGAQRLGAAGDAVVAGKGKDAAELAWFLGALDRLAYGLRILGHGTKRASARFGAVVHAIRSNRDLEKRCEPTQSRARRAAHDPSQSARSARPQRADGQAGAAAPQRPHGRQSSGPADRGTLPSSICCRANRASTVPGVTPFPIRSSATATPSRSATSCWSPRRRTTRPATWTSPARRRCCSGRRSADAAHQRLRAAAERSGRRSRSGSAKPSCCASSTASGGSARGPRA